ncbi:hypothetical protein [Rothia uropygialis]|nr:hypothetical protein [Kocuria sp. 36]
MTNTGGAALDAPRMDASKLYCDRRELHSDSTLAECPPSPAALP